MCEVARNSVLQSGFEDAIKKRWLGENYHIAGPAGNDIHKTNVPNIRMTYRYQTLMEERLMVLSELRELSKTAEAQEGAPMSETASFDGASGAGQDHISQSPHFGNLPGEPLLEHVLKERPDFYGNPKVPPLTSLSLGGPALMSTENSLGRGTAAFPAVSLLAERLAREGRITSLLDQGYKGFDGDGDDIWE
jgi:hypothetical protein